MKDWLRARRSAIAFDVGAAGVRACQLRRRGAGAQLCDRLSVERTGAVGQAGSPSIDPRQLARLVGQGRFSGRDVALVLSAPEVRFYPLRLPEAVLRQSPERLAQALRWEVARESRESEDSLEVRHWRLPPGSGAAPNVVAAAIPAATALEWCRYLEEHGLILRRIEAAPCALVRVGTWLWEPAPGELWGVLDLGLRHSTLTVVVGRTPTYIRTLSVATRDWTRQVSEAFDVPPALAERLMRAHGVNPAVRGPGTRRSSDGPTVTSDLPAAVTSALRDSLLTLAHETGRCFSYVMQSLPEATVRGLLLAGGGARLGGLPALLSRELDVPVSVLEPRGEAGGFEADPGDAAALGTALLDLEAA